MLERKVQQPVHAGWLGLAAGNFRARGFQQMAVFNSRRTCRFTRATAETTIDVRLEGKRISGEPLLLHGAHQVDASTRTVVFISRDDVRRTGFEAKATVHTSENFFFFAGESAAE